MQDMMKALFVAASGLQAQTGRMRVIAENIANADSIGTSPDAQPYRRQVPMFKSELDRELGGRVVSLKRIEPDRSDFGLRFDPGHPAANEQGYVQTPNVNSLIETVDMSEAQRSYQANLTMIRSTRQMIASTLDVLRG